MIRAYTQDDAPALFKIYNSVRKVLSERRESFRHGPDIVLSNGGKAWVVDVEKICLGYATIAPYPGLEGIYELQIYIAPHMQRKGLGSQLWQEISNELAGSKVKQVAHAVHSLNRPAALFLLKQGFFVEHEEWEMILDLLQPLPQAEFPEGYRPATYPRSKAITKFRQLYEDSFGGLPWYQPFLSDNEVSADLVDADDLLFLEHNDRQAGFLWMHRNDEVSGEIEPIGISLHYQERGLSRPFLTEGLNRLVAQGSQQVQIDVWSNNDVAIQLYQSVGFQYMNTVTYLAYNF
jgi:mycothiol synthase